MTDVQEQPAPLSLEEIRSAIAARRDEEVHEEEVIAERRYEYVRPFSTAADGLIEFVQNPEGRFMLGIHDVDAKTRGFGRGELVYITGRAHSGKTQVVMNAIANNPQAHVLMFTPDEVSELILSKLVAIRHGLNGEEIEARIKARDPEVVALVRQTAERDFRNFIVIDNSLTMGQMTTALEEARDYWGCNADAVIIDFLELIPGGEGDANGVATKSQALKRWTKGADAPVICLHQASRSSGDRGKAAGMGAMRYGGECLHPDTLLDMADGTRRRAADIAAGDVVIAWGPHDGPTRRSVAGAWDNGVQPIYAVTTHRGRRVEVTGNHPFLTRRGWVRADELTTEDHVRVALSHTYGDGGSFAYGYFVGAMLGDGHIAASSRNRTSFTNDDEGVIAALDEALRSEFDARLQPTTDPQSFTVRGNQWRENLAWKELERLGLAGTHSGTKFIPGDIWAAGAQTQVGLLAALLDTDGTIDTSGRIVVTHTTSEVLARDVQALCARFGFQVSLTTKKEHTGTTSWRCTLTGGAEKQYAFGQLVQPRGRKAERLIGPPGRPGVAINKNALYLWDLVASVDVGAPEPTVAIEVDVDHTFVTNGLVTHNTEAIFVLEVFRKREDESMDDWDRRQEENTVTVAVHKNKRPPCKTGETDLYLDPNTGLIRPLRPGDRITASDQLLEALQHGRDAS